MVLEAVDTNAPESGVIPLLYEISGLLGRELDVPEVLGPILEAMARRMGMLRGTVALLTRETKELMIDVAYGLSPAEKARGRYGVGEGVTGQVVETGEPIIIPRIAEAARFLNRTGAARSQDVSFICVPIKQRSEILGTLSVDVEDDGQLGDKMRLLSIIAAMIAQAVEARRAALERTASRRIGSRPDQLVGSSKAMRPVYDAIKTVAASDTTVLIRGESGVGKELVAEAIHAASRRASGPLVKVNCAALPDTLLESELFGHEAGAFTGAIARRIGRFELADGGTIFLDEIGDFSPATQITLLRILQQKELQRVGGSETIRANVRIIAATNRDLEPMMQEGRFRQDLYYRLNVFPIHVPALRERRTDVLLLADHFVERFARANQKAVRRISTRAIDMLMAYHWPGNVRELENCMERAVLVADDTVIHAHHLPPTLQTADGSERAAEGLESTLAAIEADIIHDALKTARGNMAKAARALGVTERVMGLRVKQFDIDPKRYKLKRR